MKLWVVIDEVRVYDGVIDEVLDTIFEFQPHVVIDFVFYEEIAVIEVAFDKDVTSLAILLRLLYDGISVSLD